MKKLLLFAVITCLGFGYSQAQTIISDYETDTVSFQYFGSTLDGSPNNVIPNPGPDAVNGSANVADFVRPLACEPWAGAFSLGLPTDVNVTTGGTVCIDIWRSTIGPLALKLENSGTGPNWITTQTNTVTGAWETLCFDVSEASIEAPNEPASGHVYSTIVLFPDFQETPPTEDQTYYIDNIVVNSNPPMEVDVTFSVDMNDVTGFTTAYLSGTMNDWSGDGWPLDDSDGDGVWDGTFPIEQGAHEYKFTVDNWAGQEEFGGKTYDCTVTDGTFTNRALAASADELLPTVCYNSCYGCGDAADLTFSVNMELEATSAEGVYVAGGGNFGNPGENLMDDSDGDDVWTLTFEKQMGFESDYTFTNGACGDWGCKEDIIGQVCAVDPFSDRHLDALTGPTVISTCFAQCTSDGSCEPPAAEYNVTFRVDMTDEVVGGDISLAGTFNGWTAGDIILTDGDADNIFDVTVPLTAGEYEFKFINAGAWEDAFVDGDPCTITDPSGAFINRHLVLAPADTTLLAYLFNSCDEFMVNTNNINFDASLFEIRPNVAYDMVQLILNVNLENATVSVSNTAGAILFNKNYQSTGSNIELDVTDFPSGLFFVTVQTGNVVSTKKLIVR